MSKMYYAGFSDFPYCEWGDDGPESEDELGRDELKIFKEDALEVEDKQGEKLDSQDSKSN